MAVSGMRRLMKHERRRVCNDFKKLLVRGELRKYAVMVVLAECKVRGEHCSQSSLYVWCKEFQVDIR